MHPYVLLTEIIHYILSVKYSNKSAQDFIYNTHIITLLSIPFIQTTPQLILLSLKELSYTSECSFCGPKFR